MSTKLYDFFKRHDLKFVVFLAIILTAIVGFRAGQSHERQLYSSDIEISINPLESANPSQDNVRILGETLARKGIDVNNLSGNVPVDNLNTQALPAECILFGSKNSNKFHLPGCELGNKIKSSNVVCFSSEEDARKKGYQPAKCCH